MKGMQKIVHGTGFRGVLNYAAERDSPDAEPGILIGGNMSGTDPRSLAAEFGAIRNLRPDIEKPVWHQSLRLPRGDKMTDEEWVKFADDYMLRMGFDGDYARCYFLHDDEEGQHIHIVACRVSLNAKVHDSSHQSMKSTPILSQMEQEYGLTLTPGPKVDQDGKIIMPDRKKPKKNEIEKALRTGEEPPRQKLQRIIDEAKADRPTAVQFVERLKAAGVTAVAHVASTGRMNGFSFEIDGIAFKGSQLGKAYAWGQLSKEVSYEQTRDSEALRQHSAAARNSANDSAATENDRSDTASATDQSNLERSRAASEADSRSDRQSDSRDEAHEQRDEADNSSVTASAKEDRRTDNTVHANSVRASTSAVIDDRHAEQASKENAAETEHDAVSFDSAEQLDTYSSVVDRVPAASALTKAHAAKLKAWQQQHEALAAESYRITLKARRDGLRDYRYGKTKDETDEHFYNADEVSNLIPRLSRENARGYDIYITPISKKFHYILIDDMKTADAAKNAGYSAALLQTSSENNYQAVVKVLKQHSKDEQSLANKIVMQINNEIGDPKLSGVVRPFRMSGFSNKKPGKKDFFTRVLHAADRVCSKVTDMLDALRAAAKKQLELVEQEKKVAAAANAQRDQTEAMQQRISALKKPGATTYDNAAKKAYTDVLNQVKAAGWTLDMSKVDFRVAQILLQQHMSSENVQRMLKEHSPGLHSRHTNEADYVERTVNRAMLRNASEASEQRDVREKTAQQRQKG